MEFATTYLLKQGDALAKWKTHPAPLPGLAEFQRPDALIPYVGTRYFEHLTEKKKQILFDGFIQMTAEAFIIFEQMLLTANRRIQSTYPQDARTQALKAFALEEFYHLKAFRYFLNSTRTGFWPKPLVSRNSKKLKNFYAWLIHFEPLCILLPGAKTEIFSLQYTKLLLRAYGKEKSSWTELNLKHSIDEVHHVGFDLEFFNSIIRDRGSVGRLKAWGLTVAMIVAIQFIVLICGIRMISRSFPELAGFKKLKMILIFFYWAVNVFEPYRAGKQQMGTLIRKNLFLGSSFFRFMSW